MIFSKLAFLNLKRHLRRTLLIIFAVGVSVMVMELVAGMFEGMREGFFRNLSNRGGHVMVHHEQWKDRLDPLSIDYLIEDYRHLTAELKKYDTVQAAEPVLSFGTLLLYGEENYALAGTGVHPDGELYKNVRENMVQGSFLPEGEGIALGRSLAELLDISHGDMVSLMVEDSSGSPYYQAFPVTGIFDSGADDFDSGRLFVSHLHAEELLYLDGETVEIRIRLDDPEGADAFLDQITVSGEHLHFESWKEGQGSVVGILKAMDLMLIIMDILVIVVVASLITNALLMNVFERLAEFGTLRAIGLKKPQLLAMVLGEGMLQGIIGSLLGLALGIPLVIYLSHRGLDFGSISESFGLGSSLFYFAWRPEKSIISFLSGTCIALGGSLYAAMTATKMTILENLSDS